MKIAHYEKTTNKLLGWYDKEIHTTIPTPSIEVTDEQWQEALRISANYVNVDLKTLENKDFRTVDELQVDTIVHFKHLYLKVVNDKLEELDYDSLATVQLWSLDATFGAEATKILDWYKAVVSYNYGLQTAGTIPTDEVYLADMPKYS